MKLIQISSLYPVGSIGRICESIDKKFNADKMGESRIIYFWGDNVEGSNVVKCGNMVYQKMIAFLSRITGNYGFVSTLSTKKAIRIIDRFEPDIIHIHNIHDHCVNLEVLFQYLAKSKAKVLWTLHDCWAFTGYCCYYSLCKCGKWKTECENCPSRRQFSWFFDHSNLLHKKKKALYINFNFEIITPSDWLAREVKESFLKDHRISVIKNGIDLEVFYPRDTAKVRKKNGISNKKYVVLGVAFQWTRRKGFDFYLKLADILPDDYTVVLVGAMKKDSLNSNRRIVWIDKTDDQSELAELYSLADVFFNPTREEVLGLVNVEALACGTPVVTFNSGGSPECIDPTCGCVMEKEDLEEAVRVICNICENKPFTPRDCIERAKHFSKEIAYEKYMMKYKEVSKG